MHCSHCGSPLLNTNGYCGNCGHLIDAQPVPKTFLSPGAGSSEQTAVPQETPGAPAISGAPLSSPSLSLGPSMPTEQWSSPLPLATPENSPQYAFTGPASLFPISASATELQPLPTQAAPLTPAATGPEFMMAPASSGVGINQGGPISQAPLPPGPASYAPTYGVPGTYANSAPYFPPGPPPLATPQPPQRKWSFFFLGMLAGIILSLIFGGAFLVLRPAQNTHSVTTTPITTAPTSVPAASPTSNPQTLYQQITSQSPAITNSLQNAKSNGWATFEKPTYGCEIHKDGLHVHIKDAGRFTYCSSAYGYLSNFAFQVEMKMLKGNGGGITFRCNTSMGELYYFHVYPGGQYTFYIEQNHKLTTELSQGNIQNFTPNTHTILTVIAQGSQLYLYVNRQPLFQTQDTTLNSGNLGLLVDDSNAAAEVVYSNAQIWKL